MRIALLVAALSLVSLPARADTKAWSAAKAGLPADAKFVIGLDVAALQKTQLFATLWPKLLEQGDAQKTLDAIKTGCKIDPLTAIQAVVVAGPAVGEADDQGAAYIAVSGLDRAKLSSCLQKTASAADKDAKVTVKQDGNVTEVSDGKETVLVGWVSKDVLVVPLHAPSKAKLARWTGGKGAFAKSTVSKTLAKVNTSAPMWGAGEASRELEPGITTKGGYGAVTFAKGNLDVDVHAVLETAAQAQTVAKSSKQKLDEAKQAAMIPPAITKLMQAVTITSAGNEMVIKASLVEGDVVSVLALLSSL